MYTLNSLNQRVYGSGNLYYQAGNTSGSPNWILISDSSGPIVGITGTANQILVNNVAGVVALSLIGPYTPATYTLNGVLYGNGTSSIGATAAGTTGQILTANTGSAPTWSTATFPATAGATGTILRSNGTNWVASTDTWLDTITAGSLVAATATNVVGQIADVAVGQVLVSGGVGVVPAYSATPSVTSVTVLAPTVAGASPIVNNARSGQASFTDIIANGAYGTLTITNSTVSSASVILPVASCTTANSSVQIVDIVPGSGTVAFRVFNAGAVSTAANIDINYWVMN